MNCPSCQHVLRYDGARCTNCRRWSADEPIQCLVDRDPADLPTLSGQEWRDVIERWSRTLPRCWHCNHLLRTPGSHCPRPDCRYPASAWPSLIVEYGAYTSAFRDTPGLLWYQWQGEARVSRNYNGAIDRARTPLSVRRDAAISDNCPEDDVLGTLWLNKPLPPDPTIAIAASVASTSSTSSFAPSEASQADLVLIANADRPQADIDTSELGYPPTRAVRTHNFFFPFLLLLITLLFLYNIARISR